MTPPERAPGALQPIAAGVVASLVGFASTFALVLAGLRAVGADEEQAGSGLVALCLTMGVVAIGLGLRYKVPLRPALVTTGAATVVGAPFGAHAINLAAITAALAAGPDAHPDPARRWIASTSGGVAYLVLGLTAGAATTLVTVAPPLLIEAVAGLALFGALGAALAAAAADAERREAAIVTFVVSASSITAAGISAPFWGLVAGLAFLGLQRVGIARHAPARQPA